MTECVTYEGGLTITRTPNMRRIHVEAEESGRWCFGCRRHVRYILELWAPDGPSYYEPTWEARCPNGCGDRASGGFWYVHWNGGDW